MDAVIGYMKEIGIGDLVLLVERMFFGQSQTIAAEVIEIRHILGQQVYVVETEQGRRKMVGERQISKAEVWK